MSNSSPRRRIRLPSGSQLPRTCAAYEVDLFGRVHRAIEAAGANADAVAAIRDGVRVVVAAEIARAYAAVCALGEELQVAHHSLEIVSHEADITENRHQAGANSVFDGTRAQAQSLVAIDAAVASSNAALVQDQIAVFKALGGGWRNESQSVR